ALKRRDGLQAFKTWRSAEPARAGAAAKIEQAFCFEVWHPAFEDAEHMPLHRRDPRHTGQRIGGIRDLRQLLAQQAPLLKPVAFAEQLEPLPKLGKPVFSS